MKFAFQHAKLGKEPQSQPQYPDTRRAFATRSRSFAQN